MLTILATGGLGGIAMAIGEICHGVSVEKYNLRSGFITS